MKMNGAGIAEVSEKGTVGESVEVFGVCCSRISSFCSLWDFVFNKGMFYAISQKISGLEIKAGIGELTSENVIVQADKFIQTADAGQRFILRLGVVAVPVISIGTAYILIKRKYIIDERKYEELVAEIKSTNKK